MTAKLKALWASIAFVLFQIVGFLADVPNELQNQIIQPFPEKSRGYIALGFKVVGWAAAAYGIRSAAHSGPSTPSAESPEALAPSPQPVPLAYKPPPAK